MKLTLEQAKAEAEQMKYALIYRSEGISVGLLNDTDRAGIFESLTHEEDGCPEARLFSEEKELHIFRGEDAVCAVLTDRSGGEYYEERYQIAPYFAGKITEKETGVKLVVRRFLDYDEDGQVYVTKSCLAGLEV